ncbi:MAG: YncE family protein [Alphaproteobacteria bacterium]|nr:YncE family protein [Alphaproteobacteria bacterium]
MAAGACMAAWAARAAPGYRLESAVVLKGASPAWDYITVDPVRGDLFLARRGAGVTVYDAKAQRAVATIADSQGADIAALAPDVDRGYTANEDGSTTIFQLSSLKTLGREKLAGGIDSAFYDPATRQVAFTAGDDHELVLVDAASGRMTGQVKLDSSELEASAADGKGFLYVNERDRNRVAKVDLKTRKAVAEWPIADCALPVGMAMDRAANRLFIGCRGDHPVLAVVDAADGREITVLPIGRGNDGVVYDPAERRIFTSNGLDANIVIFDQLGPDSYRLAGAVTTRPIARTMAFDPTTRKIYTVTAEGIVDPAKPVLTRVAPFYPNRYYDDTFTVLTYAPIGGVPR